jgi:hypothetical protein
MRLLVFWNGCCRAGCGKKRLWRDVSPFPLFFVSSSIKVRYGVTLSFFAAWELAGGERRAVSGRAVCQVGHLPGMSKGPISGRRSGLALFCCGCALQRLAATAAVLATATFVRSAVEALGSGEVLAAWVVASVADMTVSVTRFVAVEVVEGLGSALGHGAVVAVTGVVAIIDVAIEAVGAVEPRAGADEEAAVKPVGTVVPVGGAVVGRVVEVAVGAYGRGSDADGDLRGGGSRG